MKLLAILTMLTMTACSSTNDKPTILDENGNVCKYPLCKRSRFSDGFSSGRSLNSVTTSTVSTSTKPTKTKKFDNDDK